MISLHRFRYYFTLCLCRLPCFPHHNSASTFDLPRILTSGRDGKGHQTRHTATPTLTSLPGFFSCAGNLLLTAKHNPLMKYQQIEWDLLADLILEVYITLKSLYIHSYQTKKSSEKTARSCDMLRVFQGIWRSLLRVRSSPSVTKVHQDGWNMVKQIGQKNWTQTFSVTIHEFADRI